MGACLPSTATLGGDTFCHSLCIPPSGEVFRVGRAESLPSSRWHFLLLLLFCGGKVRAKRVSTLDRETNEEVGVLEKVRNQRKILALGKEIEVPEALEELLERNPIEVLSKVDPELARELKGKSIEIRTEGRYIVIYRSDAVFG